MEHATAFFTHLASLQRSTSCQSKPCTCFSGSSRMSSARCRVCDVGTQPVKRSLMRAGHCEKLTF